MGEPLPLAHVHDCILGFLRNRDDAVLFSAQAVNAYVEEPRMTQDVDILSTRAGEFAEELRSHLAQTFRIAVRVREVASGDDFRIYQMRQPKNRRLADVRSVKAFPPTRLIAEVRVPTPDELIAQKIISLVARKGQPKSGTDWRDVMVLLLEFPELKKHDGQVHSRLLAADADDQTLNEWNRWAAAEFQAEDELDEF